MNRHSSMAALKKLEIDIHRGILADTRPEWLKDMPSARDNTALYYRFLYHLGTLRPAANILEIGTYKGTSAAHMALGVDGGGGVTTIDVDVEAQRLVYAVAEEHQLAIHSIIADSRDEKTIDTVRTVAPFDVLFIDSLHNFDQAYDEYQRYRELVADDGYIFFDDISLGAEMRTLWDFIADPKIRLDLLHYTGFGAALKAPHVKVPALAELDQAKVRAAIERNQEPPR